MFPITMTAVMLNNSVEGFAYSLFYSHLNDDEANDEEGPHEDGNRRNECTRLFLCGITLYSP